MRFYFLLLFLLSFFSSYCQVTEEIIQLDTTTESIKVIYQPDTSDSYFYKKIAIYADHPDQVAIEKTFSGTGQNGIYKVFYPSGRLKVKGVYANNKLHGEWTWYHTDGKILVKGNYRYGIKHGYWAYKYLKIYGRYKEGFKNRKWKRFDENHKKHFSFYRNGKLTKGERLGNEPLPAIMQDTSKVVKDTTEQQVVEPIKKEYRQAISFLKENVVFRKTIKKYYGGSLKDARAIKKHFKNEKLQFVVAPAMVLLDMTPFFQESKEGKIVVATIDSILKQEDLSWSNATSKEETFDNEESFYELSTNKKSPMTVYFSDIENGLLRIDVLKLDEPIGISNYKERYTSATNEQKFQLLLYFEEGTLRGAEYQKFNTP